MRIEPEQVLKQQRIAAQRRIKDSDVEQSFERYQQNRDSNYRRSKHHDDAGRVIRPAEQRHPVPGHSRSAHPVDGDDEIQAGKDRGEPGDENTERRSNYVRVRV